MENPREFNVNQYVSVKIKPGGFVLWKAHDDAILPVEWQHPLSEYESKAESDGRVEMQLHEFMRVFGNVSAGFAVPYETDIWLSADELKPVS